jgi:cytidylate kinase
MDNLLLKYMENRFLEPDKGTTGKVLPFVTLSREFGCPSKLIAKMLVDELNRKARKTTNPWQYVNKEIVEHAAEELELQPAKIRHLFSMDQTGMLDDLLASFSSNYKSTQKIRKTIREVVRSFTQKGNVVLVGRGGVAITHGLPNSLHIRLEAPLEWRAQCVSGHQGISIPEALKLAVLTDRKRTALIESFLGHKLDPGLFDATFNCKTLSSHDIVSAILRLMESREMVN